MGLSQNRLAKDTGVPARRINEIVRGQRAISADTALRLARFFGVSERCWLNLQARYDLEVEKGLLGAWLDRAKRGSREKFEAALASLPDVEPDESDKL